MTKSKKISRTVHAGDVFTWRMTDGRYIAVRVIQTNGRSALVCTTPYLDKKPPTLDEPLLREIVVKKRFSWGGKLARVWLTGPPPMSFEYLGNVSPSKGESKSTCDSFGGKWCDSDGDDAFLEWRWIHDRAAFEEEVREEQKELERRRRLPQKPRKMMMEKEFWSIIDLLDWTKTGDDKKVLAPAIKKLATKNKSDIWRFEERLAFLLHQIDTRHHASHIGKDAYDAKTDYVSADGFLYARCVVAANGRKFYERVLNDPSKMPKDMEFESLLSLAREAFELKTGEEFDYLAGCSYETFSNPAGWSDPPSVADE